jgi:hypothetical protein
MMDHVTKLKMLAETESDLVLNFMSLVLFIAFVGLLVFLYDTL